MRFPGLELCDNPIDFEDDGSIKSRKAEFPKPRFENAACCRWFEITTHDLEIVKNSSADAIDRHNLNERYFPQVKN